MFFRRSKAKQPASLEKDLYKIPEALKVAPINPSSSSSNAVKTTDDEGPATSWSTGIAEVALPMSFKLKNIKATEAAISEAQKKWEAEEKEKKRAAVNSGVGDYSFQRFNDFRMNDPAFKAYSMLQQHDKTVQKDNPALVDGRSSQEIYSKTPVKTVNSNGPKDETLTHDRKRMSSTDDLVMDRFRKVRLSTH